MFCISNPKSNLVFCLVSCSRTLYQPFQHWPTSIRYEGYYDVGLIDLLSYKLLQDSYKTLTLQTGGDDAGKLREEMMKYQTDNQQQSSLIKELQE